MSSSITSLSPPPTFSSSFFTQNGHPARSKPSTNYAQNHHELSSNNSLFTQSHSDFTRPSSQIQHGRPYQTLHHRAQPKHIPNGNNHYQPSNGQHPLIESRLARLNDVHTNGGGHSSDDDQNSAYSVMSAAPFTTIQPANNADPAASPFVTFSLPRRRGPLSNPRKIYVHYRLESAAPNGADVEDAAKNHVKNGSMNALHSPPVIEHLKRMGQNGGASTCKSQLKVVYKPAKTQLDLDPLEMDLKNWWPRFQAQCRRYLAVKNAEKLRQKHNAARIIQRNFEFLLDPWEKLFGQIRPLLNLTSYESVLADLKANLDGRDAKIGSLLDEKDKFIRKMQSLQKMMKLSPSRDQLERIMRQYFPGGGELQSLAKCNACGHIPEESLQSELMAEDSFEQYCVPRNHAGEAAEPDQANTSDDDISTIMKEDGALDGSPARPHSVKPAKQRDGASYLRKYKNAKDEANLYKNYMYYLDKNSNGSELKYNERVSKLIEQINQLQASYETASQQCNTATERLNEADKAHQLEREDYQERLAAATHQFERMTQRLEDHEETIRNLDEINVKQSKKLEMLDRELQTCQTQVHEKNKSIEHLQQEQLHLDKVLNERIHLQDQVTQAERVRSALAAERDEQAASIAELNELIRQLEDLNERQASMNEQAKKQFARRLAALQEETQHETERLERRVRDLLDKVGEEEDLKERALARCRELEYSISRTADNDLNDELYTDEESELAERNKELQAQLFELKILYEQNMEDLNLSKQSINAEKKKRAQLDHSYEQLEKDREDVLQKMLMMQAKFESLQIQLEETKTQNKQLKREKLTLANKVTEHDFEHSRLKENLMESDQQKDAQHRTIQTKNRAIEELQERIEHLNKELLNAQLQIEENSELYNKNLAHSLNESKSVRSKLESQNTELQQQLAEALDSNEDMKTNISELNLLQQNEKTRIQRLQRDLNEAQAEQTETERHLEEIKKQSRVKDEQIDELETHLNRVADEYYRLQAELSMLHRNNRKESDEEAEAGNLAMDERDFADQDEHSTRSDDINRAKMTQSMPGPANSSENDDYYAQRQRPNMTKKFRKLSKSSSVRDDLSRQQNLLTRADRLIESGKLSRSSSIKSINSIGKSPSNLSFIESQSGLATSSIKPSSQSNLASFD